MIPPGVERAAEAAAVAVAPWSERCLIRFLFSSVALLNGAYNYYHFSSNEQENAAAPADEAPAVLINANISK